jgi:hypothetical protein
VQASELSKFEALACRLHHCFGHFLESVDLENPLNSSQQPVQQPKVATDYADATATVSGSNGLGKLHAYWHPVLITGLASKRKRQKRSFATEDDRFILLATLPFYHL